MSDVLVAVEISHERLDAALVAQLLALLDRVAHVGQHDRDAGVEEGELAQPVLQRREVELGHGEGLRRRQEGHLGAALVARPRRTTASGATASPSRNSIECSLPSRQMRQLQPGRERVDHRDADAVQAAGHLVGVLVEFPAGMQLGHDDLGRRDAFALVDVDRDAAAVVAHGARAVRIERHRRLRWRGRPAPRRSRCRRPRRPCGAGPSRHRCRRYTCPAACAPRRGP